MNSPSLALSLLRKKKYVKEKQKTKINQIYKCACPKIMIATIYPFLPKARILESRLKEGFPEYFR